MKCHVALMLAVGALSLAACKKKDNQPPAPAATSGSAAAPAAAPAPPASAPAPAAAAAPAAQPGACVEGAYKDPNGNYCVKVPEGYKPPKSTRKEASKSVDQFETDDGLNFTIEVWADHAMTFENMKRNISVEGNGAKIAESGDFEGGNGFFLRTHNEAQKETGTASVVKSGNKVITCESLTSDDKPLNPPDACKTLRAL
ncbi:MAG TPA: hypothetical protein VFT22_11155 [Kofleriaceae bacterium]|nr:hypothetical protein [Kofleriaceae bacterium]